MKVLLSLFDHSGNASLPYRKNGWAVFQMELKHGLNLLSFDYIAFIKMLLVSNDVECIGIIAPAPCTDYAVSGSKHFAAKDEDGRTALSQLLVAATKEVIDYCEGTGLLQFWYIENPMSRIHTLNPWMGKRAHWFNPCDYAGYTNPSYADVLKLEEYRHVKMEDLEKSDIKLIMDSNAYNKETWLWGIFNKPGQNRIEPIYKENPGWKLYGGKSERTKELRSITPMGFCWAFYFENN